MKRILVLGAGKSSPSLISYLLDHSEEFDWQVTVADLDQDLAAKQINGHPRGNAIQLDVNDQAALDSLIEGSNIVVNLLLPRFQNLVAETCVRLGAHFVSASYRTKEIRALDVEAREKGLLLLNEMGLDPGIDLMSAMVIIQRIHDAGGTLKKFISYGSGVAAPENKSNPFGYVITWNPYNVARAGGAGAQFLQNGQIHLTPYHRLFKETWPVEVEGVGEMEAYANRDSIAYLEYFDLKEMETMIRGTLRYPGWGKTWSAIIDLGLTTETLTVPDLANHSMKEIVEMLLPVDVKAVNGEIRDRVAAFLGLESTDEVLDKMEFLGLFSDNLVGDRGETPADALVHNLLEKLVLEPDKRDLVILVHEMEVEHDKGSRREKIVSTFLSYGDPGGHSAMAKTVGLPAAIAVKMIATNQLTLTGSYLPLTPEVYAPVLDELKQLGMLFLETTTKI